MHQNSSDRSPIEPGEETVEYVPVTNDREKLGARVLFLLYVGSQRR